MFWFLICVSFFFIATFLHLKSVEHIKLQEKYGKEKTELTKKLGEAVIDPSGGIESKIPPGYVSAEDIEASIPRWIPTYYGYAPYKILNEIREKCERSRSRKVMDKHGS